MGKKMPPLAGRRGVGRGGFDMDALAGGFGHPGVDFDREAFGNVAERRHSITSADFL